MAFCFLASESVEDGIRRILGEELNQIIEEIDGAKSNQGEAIHEVRKHCKKIRGLLRLVRPQMEDIYQAENSWFREAAKGFAAMRDAEALIETFDELFKKFGDQLDRRAFAPVRRELFLRRKALIDESGNLHQRLKKLRGRMKQAAARIAKWKLADEEFDALEDGLVSTYRSARKTMALAYDDPVAANFHEWRKQAKYHSFHLALLRDVWDQVMDSLAKESDDLADLLGDDHNLEVLHQTLLKSPKKFGNKRDLQVLLGVIDRRSAELRVEANRVGSRLFAEKPAIFGRRFRSYWQAWRLEEEQPSKKLSEEPAVVTVTA